MMPSNLCVPIELRSYQKMTIEAVGNFIENYSSLDGIGLIIIPTGGGKTLTLVSHVKAFLENPR